MRAMARQCACDPEGEGVGTGEPSASSAQAVRDGTQPPSTVSGPVTVTLTWSSPSTGVTTAVDQPSAPVAWPVGVVADGDGAAPSDAVTPQPVASATATVTRTTRNLRMA